MKDFARTFYSSKAWQHTREAYRKSKRNLCEICLAKGLITPADWDNLQCVCRECHANIHDRSGRRWKVDELGRVSAKW